MQSTLLIFLALTACWPAEGTLHIPDDDSTTSTTTGTTTPTTTPSGPSDTGTPLTTTKPTGGTGEDTAEDTGTLTTTTDTGDCLGVTLSQLNIPINVNNNPAVITATGCATGVYADCGGWIWITVSAPASIIGQADVSVSATGIPPAIGYCDLVTDQGRHTLSVTYN